MKQVAFYDGRYDRDRHIFHASILLYPIFCIALRHKLKIYRYLFKITGTRLLRWRMLFSQCQMGMQNHLVQICLTHVLKRDQKNAHPHHSQQGEDRRAPCGHERERESVVTKRDPIDCKDRKLKICLQLEHKLRQHVHNSPSLPNRSATAK